jgi:hypothetical protein
VRLAIIAAVVLVVVVGTTLWLHHDQSAFDHAMTRAEVEANAAAPGIDVDRVWEGWTNSEVDGRVQLASGLAPRLPDAGPAEVEVVPGLPRKVALYYPVEAGGEDGCVRILRTASSTAVTSAKTTCSKLSMQHA